MARRPRRSSGQAYFHVVNRSIRREPLFLKPNDYRAFLKVLNEGLAKHPVRLLSYCVLFNHWHLVVGPVDPPSLSRLMHWVTFTHATRWHRHRSSVGQGPVYQGRFKSIPIAAADSLLRACRYVERNALRAGLVRRAQDWPWCSLAARLLPQPPVPLVSTPFLESAAWIDHVNTPRPEEDSSRPVPNSPESVENGAVPLDDAKSPSAGGPKRRQHVVNVRRCAHENEPHAHVKRPEHLRVVDLSRVLQPPKQRRHRPAVAIE